MRPWSLGVSVIYRSQTSFHEDAMNFDFSDEQKQIKDQARKFLSEKCTTKMVRKLYEGAGSFDAALWKQVAEMAGWEPRSRKNSAASASAISSSALSRKNWAAR